MPVPHIFKAATLAGVGAKLALETRSLPDLKSGEVAVKVTATAINPVDWKIRDSGYFVDKWPTVLGSDAAGEVAALGPDVSELEVGDRVFFQGMLGHADSCTFQQYCKMPADLLLKTPKNVSDEEAAGIALATMAVIVGFYDKTGRGLTAPWDEGGDKVGKGKAIVILGGATSVGQYAIQAARISGYERIITTANPKHTDYLTSLGAHVIIDRHSATPDKFCDALGGLPLDFVFDGPALPETQAQGVEVVRATETRDSCVVTLMWVDEETRKLEDAGDIKVPIRQVLGIGWNPELFHLSKPLVKHLGGEDGWIAKGKFVPNRATVVEGGLAALEGSFERVKAGVSGVKLVVRPFDK